MRVLHLNHNGSIRGGVEGYIADVARALQQAGHSSRLVYFAPDDPGDLLSHATYAPLSEWPRSPSKAVDVLKQVIAEWEPDVAYVHQVGHPSVIRWVVNHVPTVAYIHGPYVVCPGSAQYLRCSELVCPHRSGAICLVNAQIEDCCWGRNPARHLQKLVRVRAFIEVYQGVPSILVASRYMKRLLDRNGLPAGRISVLPPVLIDGNSLPVLASPGNVNAILFAGRLVPEKGLSHLIRALSRVDSEWELIVAGDGPERESCDKLTHRLGVEDRTVFLGWLTRKEVERVIRTSAGVAIPSLWPEPFGRIGPEAFSVGRPVVAFDVGGVSDWLEDERGGYLVEAGDVTRLSRALQSLVSSPELSAKMGRHARSKALSAWAHDKHTEAVLSAFATSQRKAQSVRGTCTHRPS